VKNLMNRRAMRVGLCCGLLTVGVLGWGTFRGAEGEASLHAAPLAPGEAFAAQAPDGAKIYSTLCASCHQAQGTGVHGMFPPLAESEWVTGDPGRLIHIILHGLTGQIEVKGETYAGTMAPFGGALKDAEIAAVATYIRRSWGNDAPRVTTAAVARVRRETASRSKPWTAKELNAAVKSASTTKP
jgi:mono/diheme cytochrome c family protein